ncbi:hypothetical protein P168DRAFT_281264 [Aspergillus campestris IBT 28561]|uniref:Uncharacterized protein n=1 Tax=Aspergillus campestris (strain IBT 28561) TaxID=1392248 RepID=A0A2I1D4W0_ASPC2|nr:uncharacterized protein P168DRAFT_281264 [Aspergillus campestris IBT 28561]PKY04905.1 hypothetical protein P168DRAFT_281264 [Aspergillus campestris IBT 28561]
MTVESGPLNDAQAQDCEETMSAPSETKTREKYPKAKRSLWLDTWLLEGIALSFSIACLVAIFGVLVAYDNKKRPQLAYKITLNTIISVLATGCKSSLVLDPRQRRLFGMQSFDSASRGPLGSLMIVINHGARSFVCLGAALIILLLAFDPFIQQVISYPLVSVPDHDNLSGAAAPQVTKYIPAPKIIDWKNAIMQGLWSSEDMSFEPKCSSGNCTWDPFPSIGICSQCADLTSIAKLSCSLPVPDKNFNERCHIELPHPWVGEDPLHGDTIIPGTFSISNKRGFMSMPNVAIWERFSVQDLDESDEAYENYSGLLSSEDPDHPNSTFAGVKNPLVAYAYAEIGMKKGQLSENAPTSDDVIFQKVTECSLSSPDTLRPGETIPCWRPKDPYTTDAQPALNLTFCDWDMQKLQSQMSDVLPVVNEINWQWDSIEGWRTDADITGVEGESDFERNGIELNADRIVTIGFEEAMKRIAASLTRLGLKSTNESVRGTVKTDEIFVSVQWPWLAFPASLVLLGTIFLVVTIVLSRKNHVPLWKSSTLPSFYHGLEKLGDDEYSTSSFMEKRAASTNVRLQYSEQHGRLMLLQEDVGNVPSSRLRPL